jgi:hypothetical protein
LFPGAANLHPFFRLRNFSECGKLDANSKRSPHMSSQADALDAAASAQPVPLFQWLNPGAIQAAIAKATRFRARVGTEPLFDTPEQALAYEDGWNNYPEPPNLTACQEEWCGFFDREAIERSGR